MNKLSISDEYIFTGINFDQLKYSSNVSTFYYPRTTSQGSLSLKKS